MHGYLMQHYMVLAISKTSALSMFLVQNNVTSIHPYSCTLAYLPFPNTLRNTEPAMNRNCLHLMDTYSWQEHMLLNINQTLQNCHFRHHHCIKHITSVINKLTTCSKGNCNILHLQKADLKSGTIYNCTFLT